MSSEVSGDATEAIAREVTGLVRGLKDVLRHVEAAQAGRGDVLEPPSFLILLRLADSGPARVSALADALYVDISTVSRQLSGLEESGWLARERDPSDARAYLVRITSEGERVLDHNRRLRRAALRRVLEDWSEADRERLAAELTRFNRALRAHRVVTGVGAGEESS